MPRMWVGTGQDRGLLGFGAANSSYVITGEVILKWAPYGYFGWASGKLLKLQLSKQADVLCSLQGSKGEKITWIGTHDKGEDSTLTSLTRRQENLKPFKRFAGRDTLSKPSTVEGQVRLHEFPDTLDRQGIASLLQGCIALPATRRLHSHITTIGLEQDTFLANLLISIYGKRRALQDSRSVFDSMQQRDVVSWNAIITAYAQQGYSNEALQLFRKMQQEDVKPNGVTYLSALTACGNVAAIREGTEIHAGIINSGLESDVTVATATISMYGQCGDMETARYVFDSMHQRNVVCWTAMITAYSQHCNGEEALQLFWQMEREGMKPDKITFVSALSACSSIAALVEGQAVHSSIIDRGLESGLVVGNALVNMYGKCGAMIEAHCAFDRMQQHDVVSWTAMIASYAKDGHGAEAFQMFNQMQQEGIKPNNITLVSILSACGSLEAPNEGCMIHACVTDMGFEADVIVGTAIVNMYGKCGAIVDARRAFDKIHQPNVVSWNAMITVYVDHNHCNEAIELFQKMRKEFVEPNNITFTSILTAYASLAALEEGAVIHTRIVGNGFESDILVLTALVSMYGKCGFLDEAHFMFNKMHQRDVASWNALIAVYGQQGHGKEALQLLQQMEEENVKPNNVTFTSLLSACSHAGLVDEGYCCFASMSKDHGISPTVEHYGCLIDLFGRAGQLDRAEGFMHRIPLQPNVFLWMALLGACRMHGDLKRGISAAERVIALDPQITAPYVVLSSMYAAEGRWHDANNTRKFLLEMLFKRKGGDKLMEIEDMVHQFCIKGKLCQDLDMVYSDMEELDTWMKAV